MTQSTSSAAISWFDENGQLHIRVYSSDGENVTERCADGNGWTTGGLAVPGSAVSATCWWQQGVGAHLRVYCSTIDQSTQEYTTIEWCNDPGFTGWQQGQYSPG